MSLSRYAPRRLRDRYLRSIKALSVSALPPEPVDPRNLTVLGRTWISGRHIVFGTLTEAPRLWVAFSGKHNDTVHDAVHDTARRVENIAEGRTEDDTDRSAGPSLIGYMTGLITGGPELRLCNEEHRAWALQGENTANLKRAAAHVWSTCQRECEG